MYYLIFGYADPMFLIENAIMLLTPWLCLSAVLLVDRAIRGRFNPRRSYFITTLLVSFMFTAIPLHCGCFGWDAVLEGAFEISAIVSLFFLTLTYAFERIKEELEI